MHAPHRSRSGGRSTLHAAIDRPPSAYAGWIRRYIHFHGKRHPAEMEVAEIGEFLTHLATKGRVSASTQNQALCALVSSTSMSSVNTLASSRMSSAPSAGGGFRLYS